MAGITFPNVAGTLAPLMQLDLAAERNALEKDQARRANEAEGRAKEAAPHISAALAGDREALNRVATASPETAMKLAPLLERLDASKTAKLKEDADYITRTGVAILNAPPEQQPQLYARARQEAEAGGRNVSQWPTTYDPGWVKFNVDKAMPFAEHFKRSGEGVTFAPPAGGRAPGGDRSANAIAGIESGGKYDAVGPVANDKGQRAYGKYQIMDFNVGPWTQEVLGTAMTPQQFLASPQAQDAVFKAKFGQYAQKYGSPEAAARAWFAGEGGMNNPGAKDVLGTTVQAYGDRFAQAYGPGATGPQIAQGDNIPGSPASGGGNVPPGRVPLEALRGVKLPPGARVATDNRTGLPIVKDGNFLFLNADGSWDAAPLPQRAEPKEQGLAPGYRWNADRTAQEFIPGGPADPVTAKNIADAKRKADEKAIPQAVTKGLQENVNNLKQVDRALEAIEKNPGSIGGVGSTISSVIPGVGGLQNRYGDPAGTELRAQIANIGSLMIHDRSGAAVTASETPRLIPFIPLISDSAEVAKKKLGNFKVAYEQMLRDTLSYYGEETGYRPYTPAVDYLNRNSQAPTAGATPSAPAPGATPAPAVQPPVPKPAQGAKQGTYMGPDNKPVSWQEIEATAKNRGLTPDEVVNRLGLQPTGMQ